MNRLATWTWLALAAAIVVAMIVAYYTPGTDALDGPPQAQTRRTGP